MSVSFADENDPRFGEDYLCERSEIGRVYIPVRSVTLGEQPGIRYERYPWIEKFELDDIKPAEVCCIWTPPADAEPVKADMG